MFTVVWIHTTRSLISGITLFITFMNFKPNVIFWMSLVDSTAFRFTTNAACLLFVDSIRELVKFYPITVSQFLQYNATFTHNPFLSVIEILTHFLEQKETCVHQNKFITFLTTTWLISFFFSLLSFQGLLYHCQFFIYPSLFAFIFFFL